MMSRTELEDMILDTKKTLEFYERIKTDCTTCVTFNKGVCAKFGQIPEDFIQQGCSDWQFDDVPF